MEKKAKGRPKNSLALYDDVFSKFQEEQLNLQNERKKPSVSANDVVNELIESARELRELKKQGLAK
jgi:hypothetical protein